MKQHTIMLIIVLLISIVLLILTLHSNQKKGVINSSQSSASPTASQQPNTVSPSPSIKSNTPSSTPIFFTPSPNPTTPTSSPIGVLPEINHGNTGKKQVIFTFDAGAGTQSAENILSVLSKHKVKGTFFITGTWATQNPALLKRIAESGHEIYNHTYTHPHLLQVSDETIRQELTKTDSEIVSITGKTTKPYFRPPYGERNQHVLDIAGSLGYRSVYWTIDALDWQEGVSVDSVKTRILTNVNPGTIYLMHIGDTITGEILDQVFTVIEQKGYKIVSLSEGIQ